MAKPNENDGNYVRNLVAKMNEADPTPTSPPWVSPSQENTPPRNPSYLSVSRSNNGYNESLNYNVSHRKDAIKEEAGNHVNGKERKHDDPEFVSLSQMIDTKPKNHSKYSDLGLQLKSPEKNCRSFLRNISSFEQISKQSLSPKSPEGSNVTMVGQKMQHLLHLDEPTKTYNCVLKTEAAGTELNVDVPDRVFVPTKNTISAPQITKKGKVSFSEVIYQVVGTDEIIEVFDPPEGLQAGQHYINVMDDKKKMLLTVANRVDQEIADNQKIPDDIQGLMRCASGKANLIVRERFRQFRDLCHTNMAPKPGEMSPQAADLAGFWDMVMIEVCSIFASFRELAKAADNDWIIPPKPVTPRPSSGNKRTRTPNKRRPASSNLTKKGPRGQKPTS